ncbi:NTP transferase domain-containing protein [Novosphingobium album (ex Hu et al. 2023)]|uniref:NTP transferase domain-containing protein n=1 Tax=Novosphingobium album (ex Hu et al. 2023) TaxID=2930093 RepID=A0ABT0B2I9_9SPHN|nr:NTP transferase domain-containing protein [Novosphingobium album (ex Hu et al. 2023)]MCJ2179262.1 NTP transferase domain-containing protein [Novosphingobium album (ex Hu et al. 2023)]
MGNQLAALPDSASALRMVVLAGQSKDASDPLAERFGQSHRSLIPLAGQPMIAHVLRTASLHPMVESLAICIEREAFGPVWDVLTRLPGRGTVALVEARANLADSVRDAVQGWDGPVLVTTADHALLSAEAIDAMAAALAKSEAVIALSPRDCVEAAHRSAPHRFLSLRDGDYAPCDIYGLSGPRAIGAVEVFRGNGGFDRSGARIRRAAGVLGLLMMRCGMLTLAGAVELASRRLGLRLGVVVLRDGGQAIDVDDDRSYAVVRDLLESRGSAAAAPVAPDARRIAGSS